jgi:hypothetical protein
MSDPRYRHVERRSPNSAFWGIALLFAVLMLGLVAYGYHGMYSTPMPSSTAHDATTGQSTTEGIARPPSPSREP